MKGLGFRVAWGGLLCYHTSRDRVSGVMPDFVQQQKDVGFG